MRAFLWGFLSPGDLRIGARSPDLGRNHIEGQDEEGREILAYSARIVLA